MYYTKKDVSWVCDGNVNLPTVTVYNESSSVTVQMFDEGTLETTINFTIGTSVETGKEVKITADDDACIGNPTLDHPVAVCYNVTTPSYWDAIKPTNYFTEIPVPQYLNGQNVLGCYVLETQAICDGRAYRFSLTFDPSTTNIPSTETAHQIVLDKTFAKNDQNIWVEGFEDASSQVADKDIGIAQAGTSNTLIGLA